MQKRGAGKLSMSTPVAGRRPRRESTLQAAPKHPSQFEFCRFSPDLTSPEVTRTNDAATAQANGL